MIVATAPWQQQAKTSRVGSVAYATDGKCPFRQPWASWGRVRIGSVGAPLLSDSLADDKQEVTGRVVDWDALLDFDSASVTTAPMRRGEICNMCGGRVRDGHSILRPDSASSEEPRGVTCQPEVPASGGFGPVL